jgi:Winged helix-turn helix
MTTDQKIARRKLSLLDLAADLGNVSKACKVVGYSSQQFYEIRRNSQSYGADGLLDRLPGLLNPHPNRVPEADEAALSDNGREADLPQHPIRGRTLSVNKRNDRPLSGAAIR